MQEIVYSKWSFNTTNYKSHDDIRNYTCETCNSSFITADQLTVHIRTHTGSKPFECDYEGCDKAFAQSGHLTEHKRTHTGEKPYVCDFDDCDCAFARSHHLEAHKFWYHTVRGQQLRKKQEVIVERLLLVHNIEYKREHHVTFQCIGRTCAYIDFIVIINGVIIFIEVDETQHEDYGIDCDIKRMSDIYSSLMLDGNTLPVIFIRYNPHGYKVNGVTKPTKQVDRHAKLIETIQYASTLKNNAIMYLYYDMDEQNKPCILSDPLYDETIKSLVI